MNIALSALIGSAAGHVFDNTLPPVYNKANQLLGANLFNVNVSEFNKLSLDPEVGYYSDDFFKKVMENHDSNKDKEEDNIVTIKKEKPRKLEIIAEISVILFVTYATYKVIKELKYTNLNWDIPDIFID